MKKVFCDCCGDEMDYKDYLLAAINKTKTVTMVGADNVKLVYQVKIVVDPSREDGQHIDTCGACVWAMLGKLDTRPRNET
jgi:hypothetical protein